MANNVNAEEVESADCWKVIRQLIELMKVLTSQQNASFTMTMIGKAAV
jgi:hypothetical protein